MARSNPTPVIEPYEETLTGRAAAEKRAWARLVLSQLEGLVDIEGTTFEMHAGREYRDFGLAEGLRRQGATIVVPAEHLGHGEQLAFYNRRPGSTSSSSTVAAAPVPLATRARGSYVALGEHLEGLDGQAVQLSFVKIEEILGRELPASARLCRVWWANEAKGTHSHAAAWTDVGWLVDGVDFGRGTVRFRKG